MSQEPIMNLSIQVVPINVSNSYEIVDKAIAIIDESGLKYLVGPFSTSVEGTWTQLTNLLAQLKNAPFTHEAPEFLFNVQFHFDSSGDVHFEDKTAKFN